MEWKQKINESIFQISKMLLSTRFFVWPTRYFFRSENHKYTWQINIVYWIFFICHQFYKCSIYLRSLKRLRWLYILRQTFSMSIKYRSSDRLSKSCRFEYVIPICDRTAFKLRVVYLIKIIESDSDTLQALSFVWLFQYKVCLYP